MNNGWIGTYLYLIVPDNAFYLRQPIKFNCRLQLLQVGVPVGVARDLIGWQAANGSSAPPSPRHAGSQGASPTHSTAASSSCASTEDLLSCSSQPAASSGMGHEHLGGHSEKIVKIFFSSFPKSTF